MLLWSKFNPSCIVSQIAFELVHLGTIWGYFGFGLFGDDSSTKFHHLGYNAFYCMHLMNACMDGWIEVYHFHVYVYDSFV